MCSILHFHMLLLLFSEGTECVCYVATIITDTPRQYYEYSGKSLKVQQLYEYKDLLIKARTWDVCLCQSEVQDVPLSKSTFQCFVQMDVARLWSKLSNLFWNWNISESNEISILEKSCTEKSNLKLLWGKDSFIGKKIRFPGKQKRKLQEVSFGRKLYFPRWHDMVIFLAAIDKYIKCHPSRQIMSRVFVYSLKDFNGIRISNTSIECPCTRRVH